jgi:hypothetical protein
MMNWIPSFFLLIMLQLSFPAIAITDHQFKREIREHRTRVSLLALEIYDHYPDRFLGLRNLPSSMGISLLTSYIALHDLPKTMSLDQLSGLEFGRTQSLFRELKKSYGLCQVPKCVSALNEVEEKLKLTVMEKKLAKLSDQEKWEVWKDLKFVETVSDVIDTKVWRGPELGFQFKEGASIEFFKARGQEFASQIATVFEPRVVLQKQKQLSSCKRAVALPSP